MLGTFNVTKSILPTLIDKEHGISRIQQHWKLQSMLELQQSPLELAPFGLKRTMELRRISHLPDVCSMWHINHTSSMVFRNVDVSEKGRFEPAAVAIHNDEWIGMCIVTRKDSP